MTKTKGGPGKGIDQAHSAAIAEDLERWQEMVAADESDYLAGFSDSERAGYFERKADAHADFIAAQKHLPCGCLSHENGGPSDYSPRCRR